LSRGGRTPKEKNKKIKNKYLNNYNKKMEERKKIKQKEDIIITIIL
jgi:hypothetical protein